MPFPYRAMLALSSDLDGTPDARTYWTIARFLNTEASTTFGEGLGLEVGNSIYFDMPGDQFSYWNTDERGRRMVDALIDSGHIDCLHSYGDLAATRAQAIRALEGLQRTGRRLEVWVDHATAPTNFGTDIMRGHGDEPGHPAYHADVTVAQGVHYVWRGRVTSVVGQGTKHSLRGIWNAKHSILSLRTVAKEAAKRLLGRRGNPKFAMHANNSVLAPVILRDGTLVYEFLRCNPHWGGVSVAETGARIGEVLTEPFLRRLVDRQGFCILYTHLGRARQQGLEIPAASVSGLRRLADAYRAGRVLVTTTRRLLGFCRARSEVRFSTKREGARVAIAVDTRPEGMHAQHRLTAEDLSGLTFYVDDPSRAVLRVDGKEVFEIRRNAPDSTGKMSVSIPWQRRELPEIQAP